MKIYSYKKGVGGKGFSHIVGGAEKFPLFKRGGGAQKVLPCLEGGGTQSFRPAIFPFCSPPPHYEMYRNLTYILHYRALKIKLQFP